MINREPWLARRRMIWLLRYTTALSLPSASCLSFLCLPVFLCVAGRTYWQGRGRGRGMNQIIRRREPFFINPSILSGNSYYKSCPVHSTETQQVISRTITFTYHVQFIYKNCHGLFTEYCKALTFKVDTCPLHTSPRLPKSGSKLLSFQKRQTFHINFWYNEQKLYFAVGPVIKK